MTLEEALQKNQGMIYKRAIHYKKICKNMDIDDFVQEGQIGFMKGYKKWNKNKGMSLLGYCKLWVSQEMRKAIPKQEYTISLPIGEWKYIPKFKKGVIFSKAKNIRLQKIIDTRASNQRRFSVYRNNSTEIFENYDRKDSLEFIDKLSRSVLEKNQYIYFWEFFKNDLTKKQIAQKYKKHEVVIGSSINRAIKIIKRLANPDETLNGVFSIKSCEIIATDKFHEEKGD